MSNLIYNVFKNMIYMWYFWFFKLLSPLFWALWCADLKTVFDLVVPSKLCLGRTSELFVPENGLIWVNLEYETVVLGHGYIRYFSWYESLPTGANLVFKFFLNTHYTFSKWQISPKQVNPCSQTPGSFTCGQYVSKSSV